LTNNDPQDLKQDWTLGRLVLRCRAETDLYLKRDRYDPAYCFEIWRRAIQQRDHDAWEAVFNTYSSFVRNWLQKQTKNRPSIRFDEDALLNGVFFRLLRFVTPEKFGNFPNLSALLKYLQMCCLTEVQDTVRDQQARFFDISLERNVGGEDDNNNDGELSPANRISSDEDVERSATERSDRAPFWEVVARHLPDEADKLAVYARFVHQMPPREIAQTYPQYFADVDGVYRCLKNALWRLKHDPALQGWLGEFGN